MPGPEAWRDLSASEPDHAGILTLDSLVYRTVRHKFLICKPPRLPYFVVAAQTRTSDEEKIWSVSCGRLLRGRKHEKNASEARMRSNHLGNWNAGILA